MLDVHRMIGVLKALATGTTVRVHVSGREEEVAIKVKSARPLIVHVETSAIDDDYNEDEFEMLFYYVVVSKLIIG